MAKERAAGCDLLSWGAMRGGGVAQTLAEPGPTSTQIWPILIVASCCAKFAQTGPNNANFGQI